LHFRSSQGAGTALGRLVSETRSNRFIRARNNIIENARLSQFHFADGDTFVSDAFFAA
jgi:hypothetical protein